MNYHDLNGPRGFISPFSGEPETVASRDEHGRALLLVYIRELTPEGVKSAENWSVFIVFTLAMWAAVISPPYFFFAFLGLMCVHSLIVQALYGVFRVETRVVFTPTEFRVLRKGRWDVYNRTLSHSFVMLPHDKGRTEREANARRAQAEQAKGRYPSYPRFYDDSFHIVFNYMGHRHDVVTVFQEKRALAVAARLKACDAFMDNVAGMGNAQPMQAQEEWDDQPGKLPYFS